MESSTLLQEWVKLVVYIVDSLIKYIIKQIPRKIKVYFREVRRQAQRTIVALMHAISLCFALLEGKKSFVWVGCPPPAQDAVTTGGVWELEVGGTVQSLWLLYLLSSFVNLLITKEADDAAQFMLLPGCFTDKWGLWLGSRGGFAPGEALRSLSPRLGRQNPSCGKESQTVCTWIIIWQEAFYSRFSHD